MRSTRNHIRIVYAHKGKDMQEMDFSSEVCAQECVHTQTVQRVAQSMPHEDVLYEMAELFKVFGDSTRTRILQALTYAELCVCDICALVGMTKSAVSHQLRTLRQSKLVKMRRKGKEVYYSLADDHVVGILQMAYDHTTE